MPKYLSFEKKQFPVNRWFGKDFKNRLIDQFSRHILLCFFLETELVLCAFEAYFYWPLILGESL